MSAEKYRFPSPISADLYLFILLLSTIDLRCLSREVAFLRPQTPRYLQTSFRSAATQRTPTVVRHLTVDRAGFTDRTILPVGLYDPRGERQYLLLLVHRQISPRSRISRFHFIYDKVAVASPALLAGSSAFVCARVFPTCCRCMGHTRG